MWGGGYGGRESGRESFGREAFGGKGKGKGKAAMMAMMMEGGFGGFGMEGGYGGYGGGKGGARGSPYGMGGMAGMGGYGRGGGDDSWDKADDGWGGSGKKKNSASGYKVPSYDIDGFKEALNEAFQQAGVHEEENDVEDVIKKIQNSAHRQAKKFANDERAGQKMTAAQARAFIDEFVESVMTVWQSHFYDKSWFEKVGWDGALLMLAIHTFSNGKIFQRTMKTEIAEFIQTGIIRWYEEDKVSKAFWDAVDKEGDIMEPRKKTAHTALAKAYDFAHMLSPYGNSENDNADIAELEDFVKGWMKLFVEQAESVFEHGLQDCSPHGQAATLTAIFQSLLDPATAALPLKLQNVMQPLPWPFIEEAATEVIQERVQKK